MIPLAFMILVAIIFVLANVQAIIEGNAGYSALHKLASICGAFGLMSLILTIGCAFRVGMGLVVSTLNSVPGYVFILSASICGISTFGSLVLNGLIARQRRQGLV